MKVGDLVRMKYHARQYDIKLRPKEMKEGSLGIILGFIAESPAVAQVFFDGLTWELHLDYFERVDS